MALDGTDLQCRQGADAGALLQVDDGPQELRRKAGYATVYHVQAFMGIGCAGLGFRQKGCPPRSRRVMRFAEDKPGGASLGLAHDKGAQRRMAIPLLHI